MTTIAWTGETWNPIAAFDKETGKRGWICARVSPGCEHCYAEAMNLWVGNRHKYRVPELAKVDIRIDPKMLAWPLELKKPEKVFVCSMTDLFLDQHTDEMIDQVFAVMALSPRHTFQVLTKRPERMRDYLNGITGREDRGEDFYATQDALCREHDLSYSILEQDWPLRNVWCGVSAEDQQRADERIPLLLETPAAVRWVSYEPALGPILLDRAGVGRSLNAQLDWLVVGGESGPGARPFHEQWATDIVRQCRLGGISPFVKQMGSVIAKRDGYADSKGEDPNEWPEQLRVREYPR